LASLKSSPAPGYRSYQYTGTELKMLFLPTTSRWNAWERRFLFPGWTRLIASRLPRRS